MTTEQLYQYLIENNLRFASLDEPGTWIKFINEDGKPDLTKVTDNKSEDQNA